MTTSKAQKKSDRQTMQHTAGYVVTYQRIPVRKEGEMVVYTSRSAAQHAANNQPMRCRVEMLVIKTGEVYSK